MSWSALNWPVLALQVYIAYTLYHGILAFRKHAHAVKHIPGYKILFHPHYPLAPFLPNLGRWFNIGKDFPMRYKHGVFSQFGDSDIISIVSCFPRTYSILISDPEAIKFITNERTVFIKPPGIYQSLSIFGQNVGVTESNHWTRHKKIITSSSFAKNMDKSAFIHTTRVMETCLQEWDMTNVDDIHIDNLVAFTAKIALFVLLSAGFGQGQNILWNDEAKENIPPGHQISFRSALHGVLDNVFTKILIPEFAYKLPFQRHLTHVKQCFDEFTLYLEEMIVERRQQGIYSNDDDGKVDLLGALVGASSAADDKEWVHEEYFGGRTLTDSEVKGNIYVFLLAGHDTIAHTLAFAFGLLAVYKNEQDKLLAHINEVLPDGKTLEFDDVEKLDLVLAVFLETLRMYPAAVIIPKWTTQAVNVPVAGEDAEQKSVFIPEDVHIMLNAPGLHYNTKVWGDDVESFKPSRFVDTKTYKWPRAGFLGFSAGPRACLGSKFAKAEAVLILALTLRKYEIVLTEQPAPNESLKDFERRMLQCNTNITLTPSPLPVIFKLRT